MIEQAKARQEACCKAMQRAIEAVLAQRAAPAQPINTVWPNCVDANLIGSPSTSHPAIGEPPAQQPWQYTPPAQERIQALELEVRQLTEQIAGLRHAPTPQADSQPAPLREGEWINDAGRIKWLMWRVQDLEAKLAARAPADSVLEGADPLQGAANWLAQAHGQFCVAVLQGCLMIGYNRAKRLHDASIAARKQGGA